MWYGRTAAEIRGSGSKDVLCGNAAIGDGLGIYKLQYVLLWKMWKRNVAESITRRSILYLRNTGIRGSTFKTYSLLIG